MYRQQVLEESECQDDAKLQTIISLETATEAIQETSSGV